MRVSCDSEKCSKVDRNRGFRPSDCYDANKKQILHELSLKIWRKNYVRKDVTKTYLYRKYE